MTKTQQIIQQLQLEPHVEGGYYRRSYQSEKSVEAPQQGLRYLMTSIYYLLTSDSPIGHLHRNQSDIIHYYHCGDPIDYWLISPGGELQQFTLGHNLMANQLLQLHVPGGYWKASRLQGGEYGLISEAVTPGFDYQDMELAEEGTIKTLYPGLWDLVKPLVKNT